MPLKDIMYRATFPQKVRSEADVKALTALRKSEVGKVANDERDAWKKRALQVAGGLVVDVVEDAKGKVVVLDGHPVYLVRVEGVPVGRPVFDESVIAALEKKQAVHTPEASEAVHFAVRNHGSLWQKVSGWHPPVMSEQPSWGESTMMRPGETTTLPQTGVTVAAASERMRYAFEETFTFTVPAGAKPPTVKLKGRDQRPLDAVQKVEWSEEEGKLNGTLKISGFDALDFVFQVQGADGRTDTLRILPPVSKRK